jgi:hypothetical protein
MKVQLDNLIGPLQRISMAIGQRFADQVVGGLGLAR